MNRRLFNKFMTALPFFKIPKQETMVLLKCDGVPDKDGGIVLKQDLDLKQFNKRFTVTQNFDTNNFMGYCDLKFEGNDLVMYNYKGKECSGYPAAHFSTKQKGNRLKEIEIISVSIADAPNSDPRINRVNLG